MIGPGLAVLAMLCLTLSLATTGQKLSRFLTAAGIVAGAVAFGIVAGR